MNFEFANRCMIVAKAEAVSGVVVAVMANRDGWSQLGELTNKIAELAAR